MKAILIVDVPKEVKYVLCQYPEKDNMVGKYCEVRPLPQREKVNERYMNDGLLRCAEIMYAGGWNDCLDEITGEKE